uniref:Integrase catalytic domain-containing protein n=1 Tax=Tanacetum cinerariifolium TaxID=118510 RepID=A0A6L2L133_TANCI|nr:hypothetical protein [Tanacetum cinerariifolium]
MGKSNKQSHKPKSEDTNQEKLYLLHMDLRGPMRVASINRKKYILVIVNDYSRFTWVKFQASRDEASDFIVKFLKMIQVRLNATVRNIRTDNGTEFINQTMRSYYESVSISHETSVARTPQKNGVVESRNCTLVEVTRTIKPDLSYLHVFGALCCPNNDSEGLGKLQAKADIGIFIDYAPKKKVYHIYNRHTRKIIETIYVDFDELAAIASELLGSGPRLQSMTPATSIPVAAAPRAVDLADSPVSTSIDQDAPSTRSSFNVRPIHTPFESLGKWTKDHPIANIIGDPSRSVSTRNQLETNSIWCYFDALTSIKPKNFKQAMAAPSWIDAMQEEIHEFKRLQVWELVPCLDKVMLIKLEWIYKVKTDKFGGCYKIRLD